MNNIEKDELQEYLNRIETYMPKGWTQKFGEWGKFRTIIEDLVSKVDDLEEKNEDLEEKNEDLCKNKSDLDDMKTDIQDILGDMNGIYLSEPEDREQLNKIIKRLQRL